MKTNVNVKLPATALVLLSAAATVSAAVRYVDVNGTNPTPPYTNWATAAVTIQDAVDAAVADDEIVVTNGIYATGGRAVYGTMTNRVAVDKPLSVRSVNGPEVTIIKGFKLPAGGGTGASAVRCVYLTNGAALYGFTLTNGATHSTGDMSRELCGGGVWCASPTAVVSNCVVRGNAAHRGGGASFGTLNNCTLTTNSAVYYGGGAYSNILYNCSLAGNSAQQGGAAYLGTLNDCTLARNAAQYGGGAYLGTLNHCTLTTNSASYNGGGACSNTLNHCTLTSNSAVTDGGGVYGGRLTNCILTANTATYGGGASWSTLSNCTLSTNSATSWGGGLVSSTLTGCALIANRASFSSGGANDARLTGCTLTANFPSGAENSTLNKCLLNANSGRAADSCTLTNCTLTANSGGGAVSSTLKNCALTANSGDGAGYSTLYNCTLTGNSGMGAIYSTLNNCIVYYNNGPQGTNYLGGVLLYSCTTPMPTNGAGNITNAPLFVDYASGNLRLQSNSPCINAGANGAPIGGTDLDGRPRIVGGTADIGAYEFQGAGVGEFLGWLQQYGLPTDGSADFLDSDNDRLSNRQEWRCLTEPTNAASALRLVSVAPGAGNATVTWQSAAGVNYFVEFGTNPAGTPAFSFLATNLTGQAGTTSFTDTNPPTAPGVFYRVGVGP